MELEEIAEIADASNGLTLPIARALERLAAELRARQAALDAASVAATAPIGHGLKVSIIVEDAS